MRCSFLTKHGFEIREKPTPDIAADEILLQTDSTGICAGDVYTYTQRGNLETDQRLGHEGSGSIEKTGTRIASLSPGERVTSFANTGAFSEYFIAREDEVVKLPDSVDFEWALGEPLACRIHASRRFGIIANKRIAVLGCGFMGLVCLQLAKNQGAAYILAADPISVTINPTGVFAK